VSDWKKKSPRSGREFWREQDMFAPGIDSEKCRTDRIMARQNHILNVPTSAKSLAAEIAPRLVSARFYL